MQHSKFPSLVNVFSLSGILLSINDTLFVETIVFNAAQVSYLLYPTRLHVKKVTAPFCVFLSVFVTLTIHEETDTVPGAFLDVT